MTLKEQFKDVWKETYHLIRLHPEIFFFAALLPAPSIIKEVIDRYERS